MTEIEQIEGMIIAALTAGVSDLATCEAWQGDVEDLLSVPQKLPGIWVIYGGTDFGERAAIGSNLIRTEQRWGLIAIVKSAKSGRTAGSRGAYDILDAARGTLQGMRLTPLPGFLWPVSEDLLSIARGSYVYGQEYRRITNA